LRGGKGGREREGEWLELTNTGLLSKLGGRERDKIYIYIYY